MGGGTCGAWVITATSSPAIAGSEPLAAAPLGLVMSASAAMIPIVASVRAMHWIAWNFNVLVFINYDFPIRSPIGLTIVCSPMVMNCPHNKAGLPLILLIHTIRAQFLTSDGEDHSSIGATKGQRAGSATMP